MNRWQEWLTAGLANYKDSNASLKFNNLNYFDERFILLPYEMIFQLICHLKSRFI